MSLAMFLLAAMLHGAAPGTTARSAPSASNAAAQAQVRAVLDRQVEDWNRGDVEAFMRGYWNSPQTEFVSSSGIVRGWQTVLERYRKNYPDRATMGRLTFSELEITPLGPGAALAVGHWRLQRATGDVGGVFTLVFRKFPEGWRIVNDHTSQAR